MGEADEWGKLFIKIFGSMAIAALVVVVGISVVIGLVIGLAMGSR